MSNKQASIAHQIPRFFDNAKNFCILWSKGCTVKFSRFVKYKKTQHMNIYENLFPSTHESQINESAKMKDYLDAESALVIEIQGSLNGRNQIYSIDFSLNVYDAWHFMAGVPYWGLDNLSYIVYILDKANDMDISFHKKYPNPHELNRELEKLYHDTYRLTNKVRTKPVQLRGDKLPFLTQKS